MIYGMTSRIDVILHQDRNGMLVPYVIEKEGKFYKVQDVKQIRTSSQRQRGATIKYLVNINGHDKYVFCNEYSWYIIDEEEDKRTFSNPAASPSEAIAI
ncbi:MAG: hypothetical protein IKE27_11560 [Oscillospiraceae bacterium]|nr:hypothetical protein [Oscillospiraceae bacterium]